MFILYYPVRFLLFLIGSLPVSWAAHLGRFFGTIAWQIVKGTAGSASITFN
jgi:lauroyl/myristoyl acyltransferase